jgi:hypothetical protein
VVLANPLRGARLRPGARLEVRVTQRGTIGVVARHTVRKTNAPLRSVLCLRPGANARVAALPEVLRRVRQTGTGSSGGGTAAVREPDPVPDEESGGAGTVG